MTSIANNIWVNGKKEVIVIYLNKAFKLQNPENKTFNEQPVVQNYSSILWLHK